MQLYCNGHSALVQSLKREGIDFVQADNCFLRIDNMQCAQELADSLSPDMLHKRLDKYAHPSEPGGIGCWLLQPLLPCGMPAGINSDPMKQLAYIAFALISLLPLVAAAQWSWIDKDGRKVFSDRAPPANVPEKDIRKRPGATGDNTLAAQVPAAVASALPGQPAASAPKLSGLDKELAEKKKKAEQLEADKRRAEEAKQAQAKAENCTRAKSAKATLDSGIRIGRINAKGEREVMDDAARAAEVQRLQGIIESDCK